MCLRWGGHGGRRRDLEHLQVWYQGKLSILISRILAWLMSVIIQCVWVCVCVWRGEVGVGASTYEHADTHTHTHTHTHTLTLLRPVAPSASSHMQCGYIGDLCKPCPLPNMFFLQLVAWVVLSPETSAQMSPLRRSPPWLSMEDPILTHCQSFLSWLISFTALKKLQGTWMGQEVIILSKVGQKEKDKYHMTSLICGTWNLIQMNLSGKQNHRHRKQTWGCQRGGG